MVQRTTASPLLCETRKNEREAAGNEHAERRGKEDCFLVAEARFQVVRTSLQLGRFFDVHRQNPEENLRTEGEEVPLRSAPRARSILWCLVGSK